VSAEGIEQFQAVAKAGDVIQQYPLDLSHMRFYKRWKFLLVRRCIHARQYAVFGKKGDTNHVHTMMYFGPEGTFSCELPKASMFFPYHFIQSHFQIFRYQMTELSAVDIQIMSYAAQQFVGCKYDVGELFDIGINHLLGYDQHHRIGMFDYGKNYGVCSTTVRAVWEYWRKWRERVHGTADFVPKRLFDRLAPDKWSREDYEREWTLHAERGRYLDVESTTPAHWANTHLFQDCLFEKVAEFKDGRRIA